LLVIYNSFRNFKFLSPTFVFFNYRINCYIHWSALFYLVFVKYIDQPFWIFGYGLGNYHQASRCVMQQWSPYFCHRIHECQRSLEYARVFCIAVREPVPLPVQSVENDVMRKSHTYNKCFVLIFFSCLNH